MTKIQGSAQTGHIHGPKDNTAPPPPTVTRAIAFERAAEGAVFEAPRTSTIRPGRRDPAYFEFGNVELGTKIQFINLSDKPDASWDSKKDVLTLELTGRDVQGRNASVYLSSEQMDKLGLKAGDMLQIRAMDPAGNASSAVTAELEPDDWANGRVREMDSNNRATYTRGSQIAALDGENERKSLVIKAVNDTRPPQVIEDKLQLQLDDRFSDADKKIANVLRSNWSHIKATTGSDIFGFDDLKTIAANEELPSALRDAARELGKNKSMFARFDAAQSPGLASTDQKVSVRDIDTIRRFSRSVSLVADNALEPRTTVRVQNQRTGRVVGGQVGDDRKLHINLGDVRDGDPLLITPTDNEGVAGKNIELVFSAKCDDGKAPSLKGGISTRLPGVL